MSRAILYGKLPAHGDFVTRGLAHAERDRIDDWLAGAMADARARHGEAFEERYDAAPPWRFVTGTGDSDCAGALVPSMDGVGRRFPLLVGVIGAGAGGAGVAEACEDLLYRAIGEGWDADRLAEAAAALPLDAEARDGGDAVTAPCWWTLGGNAFDPAMLEQAWPDALVAVMLAPAGDGA